MQLIITEHIDALEDHLSTLYRRLNGDLTPLMRAIGAKLEGSTKQRFAVGKAPDGVTWTQLKPQTRCYKDRNRGKTLIEYGDLMKSITYHASGHSVAVGTDRHYGKYHQQDGQSGSTNSRGMAARPFLGISNEDRITINELIGGFIHG